MPYMTGLADQLVARGLVVEAVPGWETRGYATFNPAGVVAHWTAGPRGTTGRPSLRVVVEGRPDLPGPLCNVYLDRQGVCVVVAAGRANHAGPGGWNGLSGNSSVFGIEAECGGDGDWTPAQRVAYPRLVAALLAWIDKPAANVSGHHEWAEPPGRKSDIRDWPMPAMRAAVDLILNPPPPAPALEDDVPKLITAAGRPWFLLHASGAMTPVPAGEDPRAVQAVWGPVTTVSGATLTNLLATSAALTT